MEDMVKKIIELDEHARKLSKDAENEVLSSVNEIQQAKEQILTTYYQRAKRRLELNRQAEQEGVNDQIKSIETNYRELMRNMERHYKENGPMWVDEIVNRVIEE